MVLEDELLFYIIKKLLKIKKNYSFVSEWKEIIIIIIIEKKNWVSRDDYKWVEGRERNEKRNKKWMSILI